MAKKETFEYPGGNATVSSGAPTIVEDGQSPFPSYPLSAYPGCVGKRKRTIAVTDVTGMQKIDFLIMDYSQVKQRIEKSSGDVRQTHVVPNRDLVTRDARAG